MSKTSKNILTIIGLLLLMNGVLNIIDDARILTYDIASILAGLGFITIRFSDKNKQ